MQHDTRAVAPDQGIPGLHTQARALMDCTTDITYMLLAAASTQEGADTTHNHMQDCPSQGCWSAGPSLHTLSHFAEVTLHATSAFACSKSTHNPIEAALRNQHTSRLKRSAFPLPTHFSSAHWLLTATNSALLST
jgi:hypothetical protein